MEMTPSDLTTLHGCFRFFHWTRVLGIADPGRMPSGNSPQMRLGSEAHKILEGGEIPPVEELKMKGLEELQAVFESPDWRSLGSAPVERELPFIMCIQAGSQECFVRGRMDAVVPSDPPRVIDYKFALWKEGREASYQIQMTAYSLALMKSLGVDRAIAELWYLRTPMKILRQEYTAVEAERVLSDLLERYVHALLSGEWPMAERSHCDEIECGFREKCWGNGGLN